MPPHIAVWRSVRLHSNSKTEKSRRAPCPYVRRDFRALCKRAGIEGLRAPWELRHTFVSVMSESGIAVAEITRLTGHSSARTTQTIYRHELRPVIITGADAMNKIFI